MQAPKLDVTTGSFDGAEIYELVETYIQSKMYHYIMMMVLVFLKTFQDLKKKEKGKRNISLKCLKIVSNQK